MDADYNQQMDQFPANDQHNEPSHQLTISADQVTPPLAYQRVMGQSDYQNNVAMPTHFMSQVPSVAGQTNYAIVSKFIGEPWDMSQRQLLKDTMASSQNDAHASSTMPSLLSNTVETHQVLFINEMETPTVPISNSVIVQPVESSSSIVELNSATGTQPYQNRTENNRMESNPEQNQTLYNRNHFPVVTAIENSSDQVRTMGQDVSQVLSEITIPDAVSSTREEAGQVKTIPNVSSKKPQPSREPTDTEDSRIEQEQSVHSTVGETAYIQSNTTRVSEEEVPHENQTTKRIINQSASDNIKPKSNTPAERLKLVSNSKTDGPKKKNKQRNCLAFWKVKKVTCNLCKQEHILCDCPLLAPKCYIFNGSNCANTSLMSLSTLPQQLFLCHSDEEHGLGIFASEDIPKGTQFGPVDGRKLSFEEVVSEEDLRYIWFSEKEGDTDDLEYFSTQNELCSNWCR